MDKYKVWLDSNNVMAPPKPIKPSGKQMIDQDKAVHCFGSTNPRLRNKLARLGLGPNLDAAL
jgi:hypothetical protein